MEIRMVEDWEINCRVRAHLIKWWVNTKRLDIRTIGGVVYLRGTLQFKATANIEEDERPEAVGELEKEIKRMPGVKDLQIKLVNWVKHKDVWIAQEGEK